MDPFAKVSGSAALAKRAGGHLNYSHPFENSGMTNSLRFKLFASKSGSKTC